MKKIIAIIKKKFPFQYSVGEFLGKFFKLLFKYKKIPNILLEMYELWGGDIEDGMANHFIAIGDRSKKKIKLNRYYDEKMLVIIAHKGKRIIDFNNSTFGNILFCNGSEVQFALLKNKHKNSMNVFGNFEMRDGSKLLNNGKNGRICFRNRR